MMRSGVSGINAWWFMSCYYKAFPNYLSESSNEGTIRSIVFIRGMFKQAMYKYTH